MKKTPFFDKMLAMGGKMVDFAGYSLPIQFADGILAEHKAVREAVGLFDVSHMGEFLLSGESAFDTIQNLVTNDIATMVNGQARYALMLNENGGVIDDILIYRFHKESYMLVVNASNRLKDALWIQNNLLGDTRFEDVSLDTALLALQGRNASKIMELLVGKENIPTKNFYFIVCDLFGEKVVVSRTGYTGEDGFEIYSSNDIACDVFDMILAKGGSYGLKLCGLGARDTLRMEAGMPLYGQEMNEDTLATEIGLDFFIKMKKENFIGKQAIEKSNPKFVRKGFRLIDRGIARENSKVFVGAKEVGFVTSGTHSPTLGQPIGMVRVDSEVSELDILIEVRNRKLKAEIVELPFYKRNY